MKSLLFIGLTTLTLVKLSNAFCSGANAQCGGAYFKGETCCVSGYYCKKINKWYSKCELTHSKRQWDNNWNNNQWNNNDQWNNNNQWNNDWNNNNNNNQWNNDWNNNNNNNQWNNNGWDANNQWNGDAGNANQWSGDAGNANQWNGDAGNANQWNSDAGNANQWNGDAGNAGNAPVANTQPAETGNTNFAPATGFKFYSQCNDPSHWAMTYDDGPTEFADAILDLLKEKSIKATFFLVGNLYMSTSSPDWARIVKRMYNEGHTIANHTFNHKDLTQLSADQIQSEMKQLEDAVFQAIGKRPAFMRPPYGSGNGNQTVMSALQQAGYTAAITWNVDPMDYENGGDISYATQVINQAKGKPVITLNHLKYGGATLDGIIALAKAEIEAMIANGYTPVSMEQCLGISAYQ